MGIAAVVLWLKPWVDDYASLARGGIFALWHSSNGNTGLRCHYCYVEGAGALHDHLEREQFPASPGVFVDLTLDLVGTRLLDYQAVHDAFSCRPRANSALILRRRRHALKWNPGGFVKGSS